MAGPKARTSIILLAVAIGLAALVAGRVLLVGPDEPEVSSDTLSLGPSEPVVILTYEPGTTEAVLVVEIPTVEGIIEYDLSSVDRRFEVNDQPSGRVRAHAGGSL